MQANLDEKYVFNAIQLEERLRETDSWSDVIPHSSGFNLSVACW